MWPDPAQQSKTRQRVLSLVTLFVLVPFWSTAAWSCPSCSPGDEQTRVAYLVTTALLSLLPVSMLVAGVLFLRHRMRRSEPTTHESTSRPAVPEATQ